MRENIPKKNRINADINQQKNFQPEIVENNENIDDAFSNTTTTNPQNIVNKDKILGALIRQVRQTKDSLLFAMLTNIKDYEIIGNGFVVTCDQIVSYEDLTRKETLEIMNNLIQKIDSNLTFQVKLIEDNKKEIVAENVKKLKEIFGKFIKFNEK